MKFKSSPKRGFRILQEGQWKRLCDHVRVVSFVTRENTDERYVQIEFWDSAAREILTREISMEIHRSPGLLMRALSKYGFSAPLDRADKQTVAEILGKRKPRRRLHLVTQIGWHQGKLFVLPNETIGEQSSDDTEIRYGGCVRGNLPDYSENGTLAEWQSTVAEPIASSSVGTLAVSASLAAMVLELVDEENFGVHFYGPSSTGKSVTLLVARSVSGRARRGELYSWNNTQSGFEELAAAANANALITDESALGEQDGRLLKRARDRTYEFVHGRGRTRSSKYSNQHGLDALRWHGVMLSAGEASLGSMGIAQGDPRQDGELHRLIDLKAVANDDTPERGIFDNVPDGFHDTGAAVAAIEVGCSNNYGVAMRQFIHHWLDDPIAARSTFAKRRDLFLSKAKPPADGLEHRFANRFAVSFAAGSLASDWQVVPWSVKSIGNAILRCYRRARRDLEERYPQPDKLLRRLRTKIRQGLNEDTGGKNEAISVWCVPETRTRSPGIAIHPDAFETWFQTEQERSTLIRKLTTDELLIKQVSRRGNKVQVNIGGRKQSVYLLDKEHLQLASKNKAQL